MLKVHQCRYEKFEMYDRLHIKNSMTQILDCNVSYLLRYAHFKYAKGLFTNIKKLKNMLKNSLTFKKDTNFTGK